MRPCAVAKKQIQLQTSPHVRAYLLRPNQWICKVKPTIGDKKLLIPKITSKHRIYLHFLSLIANGDSPLYLFPRLLFNIVFIREKCYNSSMKNIFIICLLILPAIVSAQSLLRPLPGLRLQQQSQLLEPLLPFADAVEKAKANDPQGWYALAIHYAKGEEIEPDNQRVRQFFQKAYDMNYSNAVFVATLLDEYKLHEYGHLLRVNPFNGSESYHRPNLSLYAETRFFAFGSPINSLSITNAADVAKIRAGYERAFKLGVSVATNELARFEQRVKAYQEKAAKENAEAERKAKNAKLIEGLL